MGIELAIGAFVALAGAIIGFGKMMYDSDETTPGTTAYNNKQQLDLAKSQLTLSEKTSQENLDLQKEQFEYQKQLNDTLMQREDTAMQRQVADLKAAGLSPLMASGGASATPLTSANAPQRDISGINSAMANLFGAYNDIFNRKMARQQFALQSKVQSAQLYAQLLDTKNTIEKSKLENDYLKAKKEWEEVHGFRDLSVSSEIIKLVEDYINKKDKNTVLPGLEGIKQSISNDYNLPTGKEMLDSVKSTLSGNLVDSDSLNFFNNSTSKGPSTSEIQSDLDKMNKTNQRRWNESTNILVTRKPTKWNLDDKEYKNALDYVYKFYADKDRFENVNEFINALKNDVFRKNLKTEYPFKPREMRK